MEFTKDLYITNFRSYVEVSLKVEGSLKPTQVVAIILIQLIDKLQSYDALARIVKYKMDIRKCEQKVVVEVKDVIKEVSSFIKTLREYFWDVKTKGHNGGRVYIKLLMLYDEELLDLLEMIKKDISESKMYVKVQAVSYYSTETTS